MNFDFLWKWWDTVTPYVPDICKPKYKWHSGNCDRCDHPAMIWLMNGKGEQHLCWDHYCEAVKKQETD